MGLHYFSSAPRSCVLQPLALFRLSYYISTTATSVLKMALKVCVCVCVGGGGGGFFLVVGRKGVRQWWGGVGGGWLFPCGMRNKEILLGWVGIVQNIRSHWT